jgi:hypothetical protein
MSRSDPSADVVPVQRAPGEAPDPRIDAARESHRRAGEQLRAAQEAARGARLARQKADAMDERVTLLEAQFLARWERRQFTPDHGHGADGPLVRGPHEHEAAGCSAHARQCLQHQSSGTSVEWPAGTPRRCTEDRRRTNHGMVSDRA